MKYSEEQLAVIHSSGDLKVNAVAGSGKTSTLMAYAAERPKERILYLAFNKSVKLEADQKLKKLGLSNVWVDTAHSMALRGLRSRNFAINNSGYTAFQLRSLLGIQMKDLITEMKFSKHVGALASMFCNSRAARVADVDYESTLSDLNDIAFWAGNKEKLIVETRKFLGQMQSKKLDATHEYYLKEFQLSAPAFSYDVIFFDEGQDASPVMLDVFLNQKATKVIVGDEFQQIYGWRYAQNALKDVHFDKRALNTSFRFAQPVADLAVEILKTKVHLFDDPLMKFPNIKGVGNSKSIASRAVLGRTNAGLLVESINLLESKDIKNLYFEGNFQSYTYADEGGSVYDVLNLYLDQRRLIRDPMIKGFKGFAELEEYADHVNDAPLKGIIELVKNYKRELPKLIQKIKDHHVEDTAKSSADVIFSTVHKAKGMEYDEVTLLNDFLGEEKLKSILERHEDGSDVKRLDEDINILYVAATRAKVKLNIPESILPYSTKDQKMKGIEVIREEKLEVEDIAFDFRPAPKPSKSLNERRETYKDAYKKWSKEEDVELKIMMQEHLSVKHLSEHFGRTKGAIRFRIKKLGLTLDDF